MLDRIRCATLDALAVVFPVDCAGCGNRDRALCPSCRRALVASLTEHRLIDGTVVMSALRYEGQARGCILAFKEQGRTDIALALADPLLAAITGAAASDYGARPSGNIELCVIPSTRRAWRVRGYQPTTVLLNACGLREEPVLTLAADTHAQKALGRGAREDNVHGSLVARGNLAGRRFVIVDDILTTGSTLREAARALRDGGGEVVSAATLAFTPRKSGASVNDVERSRDIHRMDGYGG